MNPVIGAQSLWLCVLPCGCIFNILKSMIFSRKKDIGDFKLGLACVILFRSCHVGSFAN